MKYMTFFGTDSSQAMRRVTDELGSNASILSCRRVEGGVELIVTVEETQAAAAPTERVLRPVSEQSEELLQLKQELHHSRQTLEREMHKRHWAAENAKNPSQKIPMQICQALDIEASLASSLMRNIPEDEPPEIQREKTRSILRRQLRTLPTPREGVTALVGPPGAGKTSTIAKIAADYIRSGRREEIALVTSDTTRIAAQEQLRVYGDIFQITVHSANSADEVARLLEILGNKQFVLLDTAGIGFRDQDGLAALQSLIASLPDIDVFLTLPADREAYVLEEIIDSYSQLPITGAIATHLDEAVRIGGLLSVLIKHRLPSVWLCDGDKVPGNIAPATAEALVASAYQMAREFKKKQRSAGLELAGSSTISTLRGQRA